MTNEVDNLADLRLVNSQPRRSDFVASVADQHRRNGRLSSGQWDAIHSIAEGIRNPQPKVLLDFAAIIAVFTLATENGLKFPKVRLALRDGSEVCLSRAGRNARQPGTINVTNGKRFGESDNKWYGRIATDGNFQRARDCTDEVAELLQAFSRDPAVVAAAYGKMTGNCCFCGRGLTDSRSTDVGYGPVCADRFGLEWGVELVTPTDESRAFEAAFDCDKVVA